jgi:selenocysteine lyase/cysteine desulfurase
METAYAEFLNKYPEFERTRALDEMRLTEYSRLDRLGEVYLDYTGGGLYADSQVRAHAEMLTRNVFGNPHSTNPTSLAMTKLVENTRESVLRFFNASSDEYVCIFTLNASGALKLVGESFPFCSSSTFLLLFDDHNSVNGIREFARAKRAKVVYAPVLPPDMRVDGAKLDGLLDSVDPAVANLFAYPAQSNFSGVQHSLEWIDRAHAKGWYVLLDAAAFVPTNRLDLTLVHPDFVPVSFYKMFGYPTGVGALLARKQALKNLHRPWFAGGTIEVVSVQGDKFYFHEGSEAFEDGSLNYLTIPAVEIGLKHFSNLGYDVIKTRVSCLTAWLLDSLISLTHANGRALVKIYGPITNEKRGGTVTLNFYDVNGHFIDHRLIERRANTVNISIRTGCFCNPGSGELALGISAEELTSCFVKQPDRLTIDEFRRCIDDKSTGAVRVSVGLVTTFQDVYRFIEFARGFLDKRASEI